MFGEQTPEGFVISIHAPTWGATYTYSDLTALLNYFNPRSHVGSDHLITKKVPKNIISIHAPTWGAT